MKRFLTYVEELPRLWLLAWAVLATGALGVLDYLSGFELSFALFYLLPVAVVAWALGARFGALFSVLSAVTWHMTNELAGQVYSSNLIPYWNSATRLGFFFIITVLLSRLRNVVEEHKRLAQRDTLTKSLNSRAFREVANVELVRSRRYERPVTLAYIDLDNFKTVNDTLGHSAGDALLQRVVSVVEAQKRLSDTFARLGGDEFCLLLPETDTIAAQQILPRIQAALGSEMERQGWPVTFSIGAVTCLPVPETVDEMIGMADETMYTAKQGGKNAISYSTSVGVQRSSSVTSGALGTTE